MLYAKRSWPHSSFFFHCECFARVEHSPTLWQENLHRIRICRKVWTGLKLWKIPHFHCHQKRYGRVQVKKHRSSGFISIHHPLWHFCVEENRFCLPFHCSTRNQICSRFINDFPWFVNAMGSSLIPNFHDHLSSNLKRRQSINPPI